MWEKQEIDYQNNTCKKIYTSNIPLIVKVHDAWYNQLKKSYKYGKKLIVTVMQHVDNINGDAAIQWTSCKLVMYFFVLLSAFFRFQVHVFAWNEELS